MSRYKIKEEQWKKIKGYSPEKRSNRGRPGKNDREMLNAILWIVRSGGMEKFTGKLWILGNSIFQVYKMAR